MYDRSVSTVSYDPSKMKGTINSVMMNGNLIQWGGKLQLHIEVNFYVTNNIYHQYLDADCYHQKRQQI